tara:strand:+ start:38 stop:472 length:435 start_codon:yes stop_codon:yes gene_type:complete
MMKLFKILVPIFFLFFSLPAFSNKYEIRCFEKLDDEMLIVIYYVYEEEEKILLYDFTTIDRVDLNADHEDIYVRGRSLENADFPNLETIFWNDGIVYSFYNGDYFGESSVFYMWDLNSYTLRTLMPNSNIKKTPEYYDYTCIKG